jgi:hypothetical protein
MTNVTFCSMIQCGGGIPTTVGIYRGRLCGKPGRRYINMESRSTVTVCVEEFPPGARPDYAELARKHATAEFPAVQWTDPTNAINLGKCYACGKSFMVEASLRLASLADDDGRLVYVGSDCHRKIEQAGTRGYRPPGGGPTLYASLAIRNAALGGAP